METGARIEMLPLKRRPPDPAYLDAFPIIASL
jgi:hypothetical protein